MRTPRVPGCVPVLVGRRRLTVAKRRQVAVCVPLRVPGLRASVRVRVGRFLWRGAPGSAPGVCAPAGAQGFTLRMGGAPRAEPRARCSGAEPARGPKPQAEPRRGPPPTPPPARARAACGAQAPESSRGAVTTAAAPVGCGDRAPGAAEPAPSALSPAPSRVRAEPQPPIPGPRPGDQQVSEHTRARRPRPGRNPLCLPPPNFPPRGLEPLTAARPLPCPGSAGRLPPPSLPPRVGRGEEAAQSSLAGGDPRERGASANRRTPPPLPFPSGFPNALSRAGGGGAAAPASRPILAQARGGSGIGTRLPEARDPKVRTATRRVESGGTDREGLGMEEGAMPPPFSGPRGAVRWGCPLWGEISAGPDRGQIYVHPDGGEIYVVCPISARSDRKEISVPS